MIMTKFLHHPQQQQQQTTINLNNNKDDDAPLEANNMRYLLPLSLIWFVYLNSHCLQLPNEQQQYSLRQASENIFHVFLYAQMLWE